MPASLEAVKPRLARNVVVGATDRPLTPGLKAAMSENVPNKMIRR
jgi:hypothetical protein